MEFEELLAAKDKTDSAQERELRQELMEVAKGYVRVYGAKEEMEKMSDDFFERAATSCYPGGWAGLIGGIEALRMQISAYYVSVAIKPAPLTEF